MKIESNGELNLYVQLFKVLAKLEVELRSLKQLKYRRDEMGVFYTYWVEAKNMWNK